MRLLLIFAIAMQVLSLNTYCSVTYTLLHSFSSADGTNPIATPIMLDDELMYGTTTLGGLYNGGTIYRIWFDGTFEKLADFSNVTGLSSCGPLVQTSDGNIYGVTQFGGAYNQGTLFQYDRQNNTITALHSFNVSDGAQPIAIAALDNTLVGITATGFKGNFGSVFIRYDNGTLVPTIPINSTNSKPPPFYFPTSISQPMGPLADNTMRGTTLYGCGTYSGSFFEVSLNETSGIAECYPINKNSDIDQLMPLSFINYAGNQPFPFNSFEGGTGFRQTPDGLGGVLFLVHNGQITSLYEFDHPYVPFSVFYDADMNELIGTVGVDQSSYDGSDCGFVYAYSPYWDTFDVLYNFTLSEIPNDGCNPESGVQEIIPDVLIGTTYGGGQYDNGIIYRIDR